MTAFSLCPTRDALDAGFGSGFIYARLNLNQYMGAGQKKMALPNYSFALAIV